MEEWAERIRLGDRRGIARAISLIENDHPEKETLLEALYPHTGNAWLIGITGSPGAGKSSLVDRLIGRLRKEGATVGVVAVDPTSPFTGGALLGDRVRMTSHALDSGVFIRSMGSRGSLGGLSRAAKEAARVLDAAGYDIILIETVGVGQSEIDIMHMADTVALVLTPGSGDAVQVFKAGIMEIADLFVINKADLEGARKLVSDVEEMLQIVKGKADWMPPVVTAVSKENRGLDQVWEGLSAHRTHLRQSGLWTARRLDHLRREVGEIMHDLLRRRLEEMLKDPVFQRDLDRVQQRKEVPHRIACKWLDRVVKGGGSV